MIVPVISTITARVIITAANLLIVALAGRELGANGLGDISLLVLGVTTVLLLAHVVGGGGLVYLVPKLGVHAILLPSYAWALFTAMMGALIIAWAPLAPQGLGTHLVALAFIQAVGSIHLNILVARERITLQNNLLVLQAIVQLACFALLLRNSGPDIMDYVVATYLAHTATAILSGVAALRKAGSGTMTTTRNDLGALFRQGGTAQITNLFQLANYRAAYYLIEAFRGTAAVGVYSVAMQLAEGSWLVPKSLGGVLYSKVSNLEEQQRQVLLTTMLFKISVLVGATCSALLIMLPDMVFPAIFGAEVHGLRPILACIAPGLIAMSGSQVLSHFFSGTGRVHQNLVGSGLGLLVTMVLGCTLIPAYGVTGAALTASAAYTTSLLYQLAVFVGHGSVGVKELLPQKGDLRRARLIRRHMRSKGVSKGSYL